MNSIKGYKQRCILAIILTLITTPTTFAQVVNNDFNSATAFPKTVDILSIQDKFAYY